MCFESDSTMEKPNRKWGYKSFSVGKNGRLLGEYSRKKKERKRGEWLNEKDFRPMNNELYFMSSSRKKGWRVFLLKKDAKEWANWSKKIPLKLLKVKFRDIIDFGWCVKGKAIVAKEIFIPNE